MKSRRHPEILIYVDGLWRTDAKLLSVDRSTGRAGCRNSATFVLKMRSRPPEGTPIQADIGRNLVGSRCDVVLVSPSYTAAKRNQAIHFGRIVNRELLRNENAEQIVYTSRLDDHMIGKPVQGRPTVKRPRSAFWYIRGIGDYLEKVADIQRATVGGDLIFNPLIDGLRYPNKSFFGTEEDSGNYGDNDPGFPLFVDVTSIPQELSVAKVQFRRQYGLVTHISFEDVATQIKEWLKHGVQYWRVRDAVHHLIWTLNPDQKYVRNPLPADINAIFDQVIPDDRGQYLSGFTIEYGTPFTTALRRLLEPFGVDYGIQFLSQNERQLVLLWQDDNSRAFKLPIQNVNEQVDSRADKIQSFRLRIDETQESANAVEIIGGYPLAEVTIELVPAWKPLYDDTGSNGLALMLMERDPEKGRVWRDWVGNETGEYTKYKRTGQKAPKQPDFSTVFATRIRPYFEYLFQKQFDNLRTGYNRQALVVMPFVERRRRLLPMLTCDNYGQPLGEVDGVEVEFSVDDGYTWTPVTELEDQRIQILRDEIGIRFAGMVPPTEMMSAGIENCRVRVTGCLEADAPLRVVLSEAHDTMPDERRAVIQLPNQFAHHYVVGDGDYKSKYHSELGPLTSNRRAKVRCDSKAMMQAAIQYLDSYFYARMEGQLVVDHIDYIPSELFDALGGLLVGGNRGITIESGYRRGHRVLPFVRSIQYDNESQTQVLDFDTRPLPVLYW